MDRLQQIHRRQVARFLDHLKRTGQFTPELEKDVKRAFGFVFEDVESAVSETGKHGTHTEPVNGGSRQ